MATTRKRTTTGTTTPRPPKPKPILGRPAMQVIETYVEKVLVLLERGDEAEAEKWLETLFRMVRNLSRKTVGSGAPTGA